MSTVSPEAPPKGKDKSAEYQDCTACRVIGTGALGGSGLYMLSGMRAQAPGSVMGKRIMGGVGVGFLVASYLRWTN